MADFGKVKLRQKIEQLMVIYLLIGMKAVMNQQVLLGKDEVMSQSAQLVLLKKRLKTFLELLFLLPMVELFEVF